MSIKIPQLNDFGDRLKQERRRLRMNQTEFGNGGGVQKQAQLNYEKGLRFPDADYLASIAKMGVDVQYLLTGEVSGETACSLTIEEERLLAGFREMKVREKRGVLALVSAIVGTPAEEPEDGSQQ